MCPPLSHICSPLIYQHEIRINTSKDKFGIVKPITWLGAMERYSKMRNVGKGNMGQCIQVRRNEDGETFVMKLIDLSKVCGPFLVHRPHFALFAYVAESFHQLLFYLSSIVHIDNNISSVFHKNF